MTILQDDALKTAVGYSGPGHFMPVVAGMASFLLGLARLIKEGASGLATRLFWAEVHQDQ